MAESNVAACPVCGSQGVWAFRARDLQFDLQAYYDYARCTSCGAEYQTPIPDPETIASFYPAEYDAYEPLPRQKSRSLTERVTLNARYGYQLPPRNLLALVAGWLIGLFRYSDSVPFVANGKALDVGCGSGKFVRTLNMLGWQAHGLDFSEHAVATGQAAGLDIRQGTIEQAGYEPQSFDLVTARHVIEHIPDPVQWVRDIHQVLKTGGRLMLRTPNADALARPWFGRNWFPDEIPRHLILYRKENLDRLLSANGFRRERLRTYTTQKFFLNSWDYRTGNRGRPSRKKKLHRLVARLYVLLASLLPYRGDEIFVIYRKV